MTTIDNSKVYLKRVIESAIFKKAPTSARLLAFLANSTFDKKELKETTIGLELFGESFLNETNSSKIRVSIYNLRKRLNSYYENEGKVDPYRIEIEKGQYYVSFIRSNVRKEVDYKKRYKTVLVLFVLFLISVLLTFKSVLYKPKFVLWNSFFKSKKETLLVVGDIFGIMRQKLSGKTYWYRNYSINSITDFYEYKRKNPNLKDSIYPSSYTYITAMGAVATNDVSRLFTYQNRKLSVKLSSKIDYNDIKNQNIIYVGPLKNKNKMIIFFNKTNSDYSFVKQNRGYSLLNKHTQKIYKLSTLDDNTEYAIVSKLYQKNNKNSQFMFFSNHDIGVMGTVEYFTNLEKTQSFIDKYKIKEKSSFTALFKVKGQERVNLSLELITVSVIN